jgi:bifunctional DNase/RNase
MREVQVLGVRLQMPNNAPVVLLKDESTGRLLPIWVGSSEAASIALGLQGVTAERPLTHDLLLNVLQAVDKQLQCVEVTHMTEHVFFSDLVFSDGTRVSARPSDAIALAVRDQVPVLVDEGVLAAASVDADEEEGVQEEEVDVEQFRAFLDSITPEDFQEPNQG